MEQMLIAYVIHKETFSALMRLYETQKQWLVHWMVTTTS